MTASTLAVIVPSRGRPRAIEQLAKAWADTGTTATLIVAVDDDDPTLADYLVAEPLIDRGWIEVDERRGMCGTLNAVAVRWADDFDHLGFMGDDHRPRTVAWDRKVRAALDATRDGIAYGDDLFQSENLPTAVFMSSRIVQVLGYMAPPRQRHLYLDNAWLELGRALGTLRYLPDVIIEHVHPAAGKADWDAGYIEVNSGDVYEHDAAEFARWRADDLPAAIDRLKAT